MKAYAIATTFQMEDRKRWISKIEKFSGKFSDAFERLQDELSKEIKKNGGEGLISHLRLCDAIPERYGHDSSAEKLYSKYTDALLAEAFSFMGIGSTVCTERADAADVECASKNFTFVADAKAFRLSRTAKNQKDFKIQAMDGWKRGRDYALVVGPIYQFPIRSSQIYHQAVAREVCILSYSHLAVLVALAGNDGNTCAVSALHKILATTSTLNPSKDAQSYWKAHNMALLGTHPSVSQLWKIEKLASIEAMKISKEEALTDLAYERERILKMSKALAVRELIKKSHLENRVRMVNRVSDTGILDLV